MTTHDDSKIPGGPAAAEPNNGPFEVKKESLRSVREAPRSQRKFALVTPRDSMRPAPSGAPSPFGSSSVTSDDSDDELDMSVPTLEPPDRQYDCKHYETCLDLAASLNWISFSCKGCVGEVNQALYWRAHQVQRKDSVARALCELRPLESVDGNRRTGGECETPTAPQGPSDQGTDSHADQKTIERHSRLNKAVVVPITSKTSPLEDSIERVPPSATSRIDFPIGELGAIKDDSSTSKDDE